MHKKQVYILADPSIDIHLKQVYY